MTREEAIEYWERFNAEIDDLYDTCTDAEWDVLAKQREIVEYTISALRQQEHFRDVTKKIEPLTNADRIRAMSDEELADFLAYTWATSARAWQKDPGETLHWLQMPEKEDDNA